jgi:hypothetical protein
MTDDFADATAAAQGEALTDEQIDAAVRKEMGPWMEDPEDLVLYRQVARAVLRASIASQGEAPPPSVPAPEILEVLRFCLRYDGGQCLGDHPEMLAKARAAIAKSAGDTL